MSASTETAQKRSLFSISLLHSVVLAVIAIGSIYEWQKGGQTIASSVYILFYAHIAFSLVSGKFSGSIAVTWILLLIVFGIKQALALIGDVIPFGAISAQIQQEPTIGLYVNNFNENIAFMGISGAAVGLLVFLLFLGLSVAARFSLDENGEGMTERVLGIVSVIIVAILTATTLFGGTVGTDGSANGIIAWYLMPFISALRSVPVENGGIIALAGMLIAPMLAIFITQTKPGAKRWLVRLLLLLCLAGFAGLAYYGSQVAEQDVLFRSQILLVCYFAYFLLAPFLTSRMANSA